MRKIKSILMSIFLGMSLSISATTNGDIKDLLNGLGGGSGSSSDIVNGIGSVLNGVLSSSKISVSDIVGSWKYVEPAVEFKSDNLLQKAGGAAASSVIVGKIKPYYEKAGIQNLLFVVEEDSSFSLSVGKIKASGTIEPTENNGQFDFVFKAVGSLKLGKITAYLSKNISGQLTLTFDASKLMNIVNGIAKLSSNSTIQTVSSLLNSYEGLTVGFVMSKN